MRYINKFFIFCAVLILLFEVVNLPTDAVITSYSKGDGAMGCYMQQSATLTQASLPGGTVVSANTWNGIVESELRSYYTAHGYQGVDSKTFKCSRYRLDTDSSITNKSEYKEVMVDYEYQKEVELKNGTTQTVTVVGHTTVYTDYPFGIDDARIDMDGGRLVISNLMSSDVDAWNVIFESLSRIIVGISGVGVLCCLLAFIIQFIKLGTVADNPSERQRVVQGILWTGVGTAGCSSAALIFGLMYNIL
jgi:hypothetical protein